MPNAQLAYDVLDHIDADPESWNQGTWFTRPPGATDCGTQACFAGWAAILSGHLPTKWDEACDCGDCSEGVARGREGASFVKTENGPRYVREVARDLLGIENDDCYELFDGWNTRVQLGYEVERIFGPRPE